MNIEHYPVQYQSAFRPALFVIGGVDAPLGIDVSILPSSGNTPLGVKRFYGSGRIAVNAAPYARRLLSPSPLCGRPMGLVTDEQRCAWCRVSAEGFTSAAVCLTGGTHDATLYEILSAAPEKVKIRAGEIDEVSVVSAGTLVKPFIRFAHGGREFTVDTLSAATGAGMHTFVVDTAAVGRMFAEMTEADAGEMTAFSVVIRMTLSGGDIYRERHYEVDGAPHDGCRLAWVNRYGVVDYYTFPTIAERGFTGSRERIRTVGGWRAVATGAGEWTTLVSEMETPETLGWLAELLSSPAVWRIGGGEAAAVDAADASVGFDPRRPGRLALKIRPSSSAVSRKF